MPSDTVDPGLTPAACLWGLDPFKFDPRPPWVLRGWIGAIHLSKAEAVNRWTQGAGRSEREIALPTSTSYQGAAA